jgi:predicted glycosyltransferase
LKRAETQANGFVSRDSGASPGTVKNTLRVWVDILTPKQVLFFGPLIRELETSGAEVLATSRRYREVGPLADRADLELRYVGDRGAKGQEEQLLAATRRQVEMIPVVKEFGPSVAVSIASAVCARVAFGLGIKHIAVNDSPHSEVAGKLSLPLSYHLLCPWVIPYKAWEKFGIEKKQVTTYHALDPAAWLKRDPLRGPVPKLDSRKKTITVRVQESDAPYLARADMGWTDKLLSSLLSAFPDANLVALCRYDYQVDEVKSKFGSKWVVPDDVVSGHDLLAATDLFIGMGGTMTAEAALMGVPAISAFQGSLYTDAYLESVGLLVRLRDAASIVTSAKRFATDSYKSEHARKAKRILDSMEDPIPKIAGFVEKTAKQA